MLLVQTPKNMISLNTSQKLSGAAAAYLIVGNLVIGLVVIGIGIWLLSGGSIPGTTTVNGVATPITLPPVWPGVLLILFGIALPLYRALWCRMFSFAVTDLNITITSGSIPDSRPKNRLTVCA